MHSPNTPHLTFKRLLLAACTTATFACSSSASDSLGSFEDWKSDTGYVGSRAAELDATFTGTVRVELPGQSAAELQAIADDLLANPSSYQHREITLQVTEQLKYARNALKAQKFDLNLEGGSPSYSRVIVDGEGLTLEYQVTVESLVKFKELEAQGLKASDLVGKVIEPKLPKTPAGLYERVGAKCATDGDSGQPPDEHDLNENNLFYYFDETRAECPLTEAELVLGHYEVTSSLDAKIVYPEYDRLVADGEISMVVIFGQIKHGELSPWDWGFRSFADMTDRFEDMGFSKTESYPDNTGHQLSQTYSGGLKVTIKMFTPVGFADNVPSEESSERFRNAIRSNEIVYYNGHAFYGSLNVLDEPTAYPENGYQIINMDACWSYAYYTKQVFRNKATEADPEGFALADVVNNTEPGITGSEATGAVLYENIFIGADRVFSGGDAKEYSWNNMIQYMNVHAEERAARRTTYPDPEIYGVSGVTTNAYQP